MDPSLPAAARALRQAGEQVGTAAALITDMDPGQQAFGATGGGALAELGADLHQCLRQALELLSAQALATSGQLAVLAGSVDAAASSYQAIDRMRMPGAGAP
jgi:hypothetical protein